MHPRLSVVTVTYNAREGFQKTLASVNSQTARSQLEYVVIDGASTDGTLDAIRGAAAHGEVDVWLSEKDNGIYDAMNKAVTKARGEYVLFMNAADTFVNAQTVERLVLWMETAPGFLWGDCLVERKGQLLLDPAKRMLRFLYRQMTVSHQSLAVRTDLLRTHPFDLQFRVAADYAVLCALVSEKEKGVYCSFPIAATQDEGFSSRNFFQGLSEKRELSHRYFPAERWRADPYFLLLWFYMTIKLFFLRR